MYLKSVENVITLGKLIGLLYLFCLSLFSILFLKTPKIRGMTSLNLQCNHFSSYIYYIPPPLTVHFPMSRSVRYQPILHTLYYTLHTEHAYCLSYRFLNNVVITTVIEMVEMFKYSMEDFVTYIPRNLVNIIHRTQLMIGHEGRGQAL